jgi:hypothetical protein
MLVCMCVVRTLRLVIVLAVFSVAPNLWAQVPSVGEQLREREHALATALQANDRTSLEAILDTDFILRGTPDVSREEWIARAIAYCWGQTFILDEFTARDESGSPVASFVMTFDQDPITCEPATVRSLITDIWVRRGSEWRLLVRHSSGVTEGGRVASLQQQFAVVPARDPVWQLESELSFVATSGNTDTQTIGTASDLVHRTERWQTTARASFVRSIADGLESARALLFEARPGRKLTPRLTVFARGGFRRDRFAGLDQRVSMGSGLAYNLLDRPDRTLQIEGGGGFRSRTSCQRSPAQFCNGTGSWPVSMADRADHPADGRARGVDRRGEPWELSRIEQSVSDRLAEPHALAEAVARP